MNTETQVSQTGVNKRRTLFLPARKVELRVGELHRQYSIPEPVGAAGVSQVNHDHREAEYLLLAERVKVLEAENAGLQMRLQLLQELCLLE